MTLAQVSMLALSGSAPLIAVTLGLTQWLKKSGVSGVALNVAAMLIGLAFGGMYLYATTSPSDLLGWFLVAVYGVLIGLITSGVYDAAASIAAKARP